MPGFSHAIAFGAVMLSAPGLLFSQGGGGVISSAGSVSSRGNGNETRLNYNYPSGAGVVVIAGAPYSGHRSFQNVRTLANGIQLKNSVPNEQPMNYRDSAGRTRTDVLMSPVPATVSVNVTPRIMLLPEIVDPVAGFRYVIDDENRIAHRIAIRALQKPAGARAVGQAVPQASPRMKANGVTLARESLGMQSMFGITVTGQRTTTTYPPGTYQGNDGPLTSVSEVWRSAQYSMVLLSKDIQPDGSVSTMTMKDFTASEPDPALFMVPPGYQIVDETGGFTITLSAGPK